MRIKNNVMFDWNQPAPAMIYFNAFTNNSHWGDERDFFRIVDANGNLVNSVNIQDGQTYTVKMLVHNDASLNLNLVATGVKARLTNSNGAESVTSHTIAGTVRADNFGMTNAGNAGLAGQVTDTVTFNGSNNFTIAFVPGSAQYQTQFSSANDYTTNPTATWTLPDAVATTNGTPIGFNGLDGKIPGCWPRHGILTAKFIAYIE